MPTISFRIVWWSSCIILISLLLVILISLAPRNLIRVIEWHKLADCAGNSVTISKLRDIWKDFQFSIGTDCNQIVDSYIAPDITSINLWLQGKQTTIDQINRITPFTRREIFVWRNQSFLFKPAGYAPAGTKTVAVYIAQLAAQAWDQAQYKQAFMLARAALAIPTPEIAEILIHNNYPKDKDTFIYFEKLSNQIANTLPTYVENFINWFEVAISFKQWQSADNACKALRRIIDKGESLPYQSNALVCHARLLFYQNDFIGAYTELISLNRRWPQNALVLEWLGTNARIIGKCSEALLFFQQGVQFTVNSNSLLNMYWQTGDCYRQMGKLDLAQKAYETALSYDTDKRYHDQLIQLIQLTHSN